jgi:predicted dehydrogenase
MGGGVILDLSHEIDYLYYLFGNIKTIKANAKKIGNITKDTEDFADILLELDTGIFCNVHLNCFSRLKCREILLDFTDQTVRADLVTNTIEILKKDGRKRITFDFTRDDMFLSQLQYFFTNLKKKTMMNNLDESIPVFNTIMKIKKVTHT